MIAKVVKPNTNYINPDWDVLKRTNPEIVGWIYIPNTAINYPVVQKKGSSTYYLNRNAMLGYDELGAIFLDGFAESDFSDLNTVIYGHSVVGGGMFTDIKKFANKDFFDVHPYFYLLTPEQNYKCMIYTFAKPKADSVYYLSNPTMNEITEMMNKSVFNHSLSDIGWKGLESDEISGKNFVTLSTCNLDYGLHSDRRLTLTGFLKKYNGKIKVED